MKKRKLPYFIAVSIGVFIALAVGFLSSLVTRQAISEWYVGLEKPFFSPPNWLFAPVWTLLYILMGWAVGSVWYFGRRHRWGKTALYHFGAQLIFNGLWSLVFFGLRSPLLGMLVIITLWILIERTIYWFRLVDRKAAFLLYPYFAWVSFAALLNGAILYLN
ncbi:tryptophan-rich sensory protein [Flavobacteriaceae bacterium]|nr:tryptophan-rich sensory protein [Flavobacteriaceae bacterium]MDA9016105.1 tryptophan-rich sensory protein [Flavobacteriaceae bacterium]MDA9572011.1 tryptophan-rich sensory protein [Flavobacteriaceae bacterium]